MFGAPLRPFYQLLRSTHFEEIVIASPHPSLPDVDRTDPASLRQFAFSPCSSAMLVTRRDISRRSLDIAVHVIRTCTAKIP